MHRIHLAGHDQRQDQEKAAQDRRFGILSAGGARCTDQLAAFIVLANRH